MADRELDVRQLRKTDKHPLIFASYADLPVGDSFVLVNNHDPQHLHAEFEADYAGSYGWEYIEAGPTVWRIRIQKRTTIALPRTLINTADIAGAGAQPDTAGVAWKLEVRERDLDSNVIALAPHGRIDTHTGADVDVLIHVVSGSGRLTTEVGTVELAPGALLWLQRRSRREFTAGPDGLRYLTVHQKREILPLSPTVGQT
ncbi:hypothetical protein CKW46_07325 [Mycobacterium liflandii]|nr:hypothetical protein CKW46_07325 [Mycobacterium liflandii]